MRYSQEIEGLNSVKHIRYREISSCESRQANKGSGFRGGGGTEAENRGCIYFAQKVTFIQINEHTNQSRNLISVIQNSLQLLMLLFLFPVRKLGKVIKNLGNVSQPFVYPESCAQPWTESVPYLIRWSELGYRGFSVHWSLMRTRLSKWSNTLWPSALTLESSVIGNVTLRITGFSEFGHRSVFCKT
jgi:hypothetical protein